MELDAKTKANAIALNDAAEAIAATTGAHSAIVIIIDRNGRAACSLYNLDGPNLEAVARSMGPVLTAFARRSGDNDEDWDSEAIVLPAAGNA